MSSDALPHCRMELRRMGLRLGELKIALRKGQGSRESGYHDMIAVHRKLGMPAY